MTDGQEKTHNKGWPKNAPALSLADVHSTVNVPGSGPSWRKMAAFMGPGYIVAVGYMDPGNWATDLAGGAHFGYRLLSVVFISNLMAVFLPGICASS